MEFEVSFLVIFLGACYFFYLSLKGLLFSLFGNHTILYNEEQISVETSVFKIASVKKFKWVDIETIGGFSPNNKPGISESLGIKPKDKSIFFFGHLINNSKKREIAKGQQNRYY